MQVDNKKLCDLLQFLIKNKRCNSNDLQHLLGLSKDSFYRRLRGETDFTLNEVYALQNTLKFSIDSFNGGHNSKVFSTKQFAMLDTPIATLENYVTELYNDMYKLKQGGIKHLYYAAKDLPLFCFFSSPLLTSFKLYFWYISIFDAHGKRHKYNEAWLPDTILQKANSVFELYNECPSTEIWNFETINSTLHQVHYCIESGLITKAQSKNILITLESFVQKINTNCEQKSKDKKAEITMYLNEILLLDNSVIFDLGLMKIFYLPYQTLSFLSSTNGDFTTQNMEWFNKQLAKSIIISGDNQNNRDRLINYYLSEIEKYR
jgi:hypothetical protein